MPIKTTSEMEIYIKNLYEKLKPLAEEEQIYEPLKFCFAEALPHNYPGDYCYSDGKYYYYGSIGDRGLVAIEKTSSFFEVAYWIFKFQASAMAYDYEKKHRIEGKDFRRIVFKKKLELLGIIGEEYRRRAELEIAEILKKHPYQD